MRIEVLQPIVYGPGPTTLGMEYKRGIYVVPDDVGAKFCALKGPAGEPIAREYKPAAPPESAPAPVAVSGQPSAGKGGAEKPAEPAKAAAPAPAEKGK